MLKPLAMILAASSLPIAALSLQSPPETPESSDPAQHLLAGCGDVPEVVALVQELGIRKDRVAKALADMDERRDEIAVARNTLTAELRRLKSAGDGPMRSKTHGQQAVEQDIERLVALYEAMKPKDAAEVIATLPDTFSAELLMRVSPDIGARILAAIDAEKAAVLTTYMGARSAASR